jgi:hypothetical protein
MDSTTSRFSSPGIPNIRSTPSFSRAAMNRSEALSTTLLHDKTPGQSARSDYGIMALISARRRSALRVWAPHCCDLSGFADRAIEGRAQIALAERLEQALNGTASEKLCAKISIAVGRNKYNRNVQLKTAQFGLQLRS